MAFRDDQGVRAEIRSKLKAYMDEPPVKGAEQIAKDVEDHRIDIAPESNQNRAAIDHGTIMRFLEGRIRTQKDKVEILYNLLAYRGRIIDPSIEFSERQGADPIFRLIQQFFGMRDRNLEQCGPIVGRYRAALL